MARIKLVLLLLLLCTISVVFQCVISLRGHICKSYEHVPVLSNTVQTTVEAIRDDVTNKTPTCPLKMNNASIYLCRSYKTKKQNVYLTLFTSMTYRISKLLAYNRTLDLWPLLGPQVTPVLFLAPSGERGSTDYYGDLLKIARKACERGWDVLVAPHCNQFNYPVLSSMFVLTRQQYDSYWYGYSNGDVLFTDSLLENLRFLERQNTHDADFLIGRRHDVVIPKSMTLKALADLPPLLKNSTPHETYGQDYFIVRKDRFPWDSIPPFVIGRPKFDNWLVWYTYKKNIPTVDLSDTCKVLHQSLEGVLQDHKTIKVNDGDYNEKLFGTANILFGHTTCTRFMTSYALKGNATSPTSPFVLLERQRNDTLCPAHRIQSSPV